MKYYLIVKKDKGLREVLLGLKDNAVFFPREIPIDKSFLKHTETLEKFDWPELSQVEVFEACQDTTLPSHFQWFSIENIPHFMNQEGALFCRILSLFWPHLHFHISKLYKPPQLIYKIDPQKEVVFYGGSFNPWHEGHFACLKLCPSQNIIVIPDNNPWKETNQNFCRWKSFKELALKLKKSPYSVYPGFWASFDSNPTVDWLSKSSYPQKSLLMGDDNFFKFNRWKDYLTLCRYLTKIYVVPRNHTKEELEKKKIELLQAPSCPQIVILNEHPYQPLSSSQLRKKS